MKRIRLGLSSDQLELLYAFSKAAGLSDLADVLAKDPSVVSRNLQRLAETAPVIVKSSGRWQLSELGVCVNKLTENYANQLNQQLSAYSETKLNKNIDIDSKSVLVVINAQKGLFSRMEENQIESVSNVQKLIENWRLNSRNIIHVRHISENPNSAFFKNSLGAEFIESLSPFQNELIVDKTNSSAFFNTQLEQVLQSIEATKVILTGFTANECIDATARDASALELNTTVVGDATASFDIRDQSGKLIKADRVHNLTLANINALYAKVLLTAELLATN